MDYKHCCVAALSSSPLHDNKDWTIDVNFKFGRTLLRNDFDTSKKSDTDIPLRSEFSGGKENLKYLLINNFINLFAFLKLS